MNRKTAHSCSKVFNDDYGQIRDCIILETSWIGNFEPFCKRTISSLIYEMMIATNQKQLAIEYEMLPFNVTVLEPERTICEKIMSLIRFSYSENPINDLNLKIRHIYDICRLMNEPRLLSFIDSKDFDKMMLRVAKDDFNSFSQNTWLTNHPKDSLIFSDPTNLWKSLQKTYHDNFNFLVYGMLPENDEILHSLNVLSERIRDIEWSSISKLFED